MQTIRITDDRAPGVEAVVRVDRAPGGLPRVESVTFVAASGAGVRPPDLGVFDVAGLLGAATLAVREAEPAEVALAEVADKARPAAVKAAGKKAPAKKAPTKKAPSGKAGGKTAPPAKKASPKASTKASTKGQGKDAAPAAFTRSDRSPYRTLPDDFVATYNELGGNVVAVAGRYGVTRNSVYGWLRTARKRDLLPAATG